MNRANIGWNMIIVFLMLMAMVTMVVAIWGLTNYYKANNNDCWKETAISYCDSQNLSFKYVDSTYDFRCENKDDEHKTGLYEFRFTEQEREVCRA